MTRQQKRRLIRTYRKEADKLLRRPVVPEHIKSLPDEEKELLKKGKHENKDLQAEFNNAALVIDRIALLERRIKDLAKKDQ